MKIEAKAAKKLRQKKKAEALEDESPVPVISEEVPVVLDEVVDVEEVSKNCLRNRIRIRFLFIGSACSPWTWLCLD